MLFQCCILSLNKLHVCKHLCFGSGFIFSHQSLSASVAHLYHTKFDTCFHCTAEVGLQLHLSCPSLCLCSRHSQKQPLCKLPSSDRSEPPFSFGDPPQPPTSTHPWISVCPAIHFRYETKFSPEHTLDLKNKQLGFNTACPTLLVYAYCVWVIAEEWLRYCLKAPLRLKTVPGLRYFLTFIEAASWKFSLTLHLLFYFS